MTRTALESGLPIELISRDAERESWRKEVHRPATHTHKWWAQRLGSAFRGILAGALANDATQAEEYYRRGRPASDLVVMDPFAGSGTTLVEAIKLGANAIGFDINPVATLVQRQAVNAWRREALLDAYAQVESSARGVIDEFHIDVQGDPVLYYFWVGTAQCPGCAAGDAPLELFSSFVFAKHAYAKKNPTARAVCPKCHDLHVVDLHRDSAFACACGWSGSFSGPVNGARMTCHAGHTTRVVDALDGRPPGLTMYAKLVLRPGGKKEYVPIDDFDRQLYARAQQELTDRSDSLVLPTGTLEPGYNTRQALTWGYSEWIQFFNARQLLSLGVLGAAIRDLPASAEREAMATLFSGVLEFNNLFCSFKGEGTGAVRHMFSHHVLKPERVPLEAHPWGTDKSSGSFANLFKSRLLRALDYKNAPTDLVDGERVMGRSAPLTVELREAPPLAPQTGAWAIVEARSSSNTGLPDRCVDLIVTDPPYFDNVHYSELADFFHAWLREIGPFAAYPVDMKSTRQPGEVQSTDPSEFSDAIGAVWKECARVLRDEGLLAFTFHQARASGWIALIESLRLANFEVTALVPLKGEMSVGMPKNGASEPSNLDTVVVCRKRSDGVRTQTLDESADQLERLQAAGISVGRTDVQSVLRGTALAKATTSPSMPSAADYDELVAAADERVAAVVSRLAEARAQIDVEDTLF